jgi:two-component system, OmpR family, response regulator CpxR
MDELMNVKEAAKYLRVNYMTVYKMVQKRRIPATKVGGNWRFKKEILDEWLLRNTTSGAGTILAVDNDIEAVNALKELTQKQGFSVYAAASGEAALTELGRQHFDLVFLDLKIPGKSGLEVMKSIKDKAENGVVVIVTADTNDQMAMKAMQHGPVFLLGKPYKEKNIIEVLSIVMKGKNI